VADMTNDKHRRVVVTGLGVVAPNGIGKEEFWQAISNGKSGIKKITTFDTTKIPSKIGGEITNFNPSQFMCTRDEGRRDRFTQFGIAAAKMALQDARLELDKEDRYRVGISVGSALGGQPFAEEQHTIFINGGIKKINPLLASRLFPGACLSQISIELGIRGRGIAVSTASASGTDSIGHSFEYIRWDKADVMITGAAEAPLAPMTLSAFCLINALSTKRNNEPTKASRPFDKDRDGFVMSEGAGIIVLEELKHALQRGANIYGEVLSYGSTLDAYHMAAPLPNGESAVKAIKMALNQANLEPSDINYISAHGTSTNLNDKTETLVIKEVFGKQAYKIPISSIKSMIGHLMGGAGAVEAVSCILALDNNLIPPTINYEYRDPECDLDYVPNVARRHQIDIALLDGFGFGGKNATIIIKKFKR